MKKLLQSLFVILAIVGISSLSARAESFPQDGSAIALGEIYELAAFKSYKATITPSASGVLMQDGCPDLNLVELQDEKEFISYDGTYGQIYGWNVEGGKTYTVECSFAMSAGKVTFYMEADNGLVLSSASPAEGQTLAPNANSTGVINLIFKANVEFDEAYLSAGSAKVALLRNTAPDNYLCFDIADIMNNWYKSGVLDEDGGTPVKLSVTGLRSKSGILYNGDGAFEINYVASRKLIELVSNTIPAQFKSFYAPGDPEGIVEFVFDRELMNDGSINLWISCGNPESEGSYYREELPAKIDGNKAIVDFTGKLRDLNTYTSAQGSNLIELRLRNVKDINGLEAAGMGTGNVASYPFNAEYKYVESANVTSEFIPASGASLQGVDKMEIWFNNADVIEFDGVQFTYKDGNEEKTLIIPNKDLGITRDGNEVTINLAVPAELQGKNSITASLANIVSLDGHTHTIMAEYDQFVVKLVSPFKAGDKIASTGSDDLVFALNVDEKILYVRYDFYNGEGDNHYAGGAQLNKQDNGTWTAVNGNFICYSDFDPYMIVSAYYNENNYWQNIEPAATYRLDFKGATPPFVFSDVKFVSITPGNDEQIIPTDDFCWTIEFDGLVTIDSNASGVSGEVALMPFEKIEAVDPDSEGLSSIWRLYPSMSFVENQKYMYINVVAHDINGALVEGNEGEKEYSSLMFGFPVYSDSNFLPLTVVPADESEVSEISEFVLSYEDKPVSVNYSYTGERRIQLYTKAMELIYTFDDEDIVLDSDIIGEDELGNPIYDVISRIILKVNPTVTAPDNYLLMIPADYFIIGDQFDTYSNREYIGNYYIEVEATEHILSVTPEAGNVTALTRIDIDAAGIEEASCFGNENITITDATGKVVYTATPGQLMDTSFDMNSWEFIGFFLEPDISATGVYTLHIPAGFFEFFDTGKSEALEAVYTITTTGISSVVVEKADSYKVYTISGVLVLNTDDVNALSTLAPGIYVINGKKVLVK